MGITNIIAGLYGIAQRQVDRIISPQTRSRYYTSISTFAQEQPVLFTFLALQLLCSALPLALFLSFTTGTLLLSLVTALLFSFFWIGVALVILIPTLFITVGLGIGVSVWAVGSFLVAKWVYARIPVSVRGRTEVGLMNGNNAVVSKTGDGVSGFKMEVEGEKNGLDV
ncbi:hypothetical protein BJ878DRAFT_557294 [Calycina marina]|uniref:Uncharacterized protein n=1 Tax=Calycina marina TaxID=1763456 RepID=A0A9P7Z8T2_9HELO|nr:hypothetical protein BJ878DRAFT_557294 [Calycina marina]